MGLNTDLGLGFILVATGLGNHDYKIGLGVGLIIGLGFGLASVVWVASAT